ncbi:class II aldolase/adducin family protein [Hahella sp. SMD15-11]|uniref:Class II aldolase/adducin family protein n=1 Tax=Thermohahella caldifontis TaxID=3142973 RepID=A0AB39UZ01_9GAMM
MEGVIRFEAVCLGERMPGGCEVSLREASLVRGQMLALGWMGQDPRRYGGDGFGNISIRHGQTEGFFITASQIGAVPVLESEHWCHVVAVRPEANRVQYSGLRPPSSETLTHAAVYEAVPSARCVVHVHAPEVWSVRARLGYPITDPGVAYGTPDMFREVLRLAPAAESSVLILGGHEDGVLAWGETADEALTRLLSLCGRVARYGRGG